MSDDKLSAQWALLEPTAQQRRQIENQVLEWLEARETSLAAEWLGIVKFNPVGTFAYTAVSACSLLILTPIGLLASFLLF